MYVLAEESPVPYTVLPGGKDTRRMENGTEPTEPSGFTMVQNRSVSRHDISLHALGLLVKLLRRRNGGTHLCCPSYTVLRKDCAHAGKMPSPRSIADWLRELALARELAWVHTGRHSTYYFPGDAEFEVASDSLLSALTATDTVAETATATVVIEETATATVAQHYHYGSDTATATVVKQEVLNKTNSTRHSAPTERAAPPQKPAAKVAVTTPKDPTPTVEAKPEPKQMPRAKRAGDETGAPPKPNKFGAVLDAVRALGVEPVYNRGRDAKAVNECSEPAEDIAASYVAVRRGEWGSQWLRDHPHLWAVCADMSAYRAWKEAQTNGAINGKAGAAGGPDQAGRPGRAPGVQGATGGTAESKERAERAEQWQRNAREQLRRALAAKEADTVPGMPIPRG